MNRNELGLKIYQTSHITGEFLLRSGQISNEYFDKYKFESDPLLLKSIAEEMQNMVEDETEILAGLEMGGIPIATAISFEKNMPAIFVRKVAKEYGTRKLAEGTEFSGKKVCVIEDVVTTGGQIIKSVSELRELGAVVDTVLCVIVRDPKAYDNLGNADLKLKPLFTMEELKEIAGEG
jgi:orotate phosphoribosyltransferase